MIHATAVVSPKARLAASVEVGPCAIVGDDVTLGEGCILMAHAVVLGPTAMGAGNVVHPHAVLGGDPQDLKYKGGRTTLLIGDRNLFREGVTVNRGTEDGRGETAIGSGNLLMACSHVAHDCRLGDGIVMANGVLLAGHITVESHALLMGLVAVHHFATIGRHAFIGGYTPVAQDAPPFMIVQGIPARVRGVNAVGLQRAGFSEERIRALKEAHRRLYRSGELRSEVLGSLEREMGDSPDIRHLVRFLRASDAGRHGRAGEARRAKPGTGA